MKDIINKVLIRQEINQFFETYEENRDFLQLINALEETIKKVTLAEDSFILMIDDFNQEIHLLSKGKKIFVEDMEHTFSIILDSYYSQKVHLVKDVATSFLYNRELDQLVEHELQEMLLVPILDQDKSVLALVWVAYTQGNNEDFTQVDIDNINYLATFIKKSMLIDTIEPPKKNKKSNEHLNILIVDDDIIILKYLSAVLESKNFHVEVAHSGIEALRIYQNDNNIDLIFMDEVMNGGMHGHKAVKKIRDLERENNQLRVPILALTSDTTKETRRRLLKAGVDFVLHKPIDPDKILNMIATVSAK